MAVKVTTTNGNSQVVPNAKEVSERISLKLGEALEKAGLKEYVGNLPEAIDNLGSELSKKLGADFSNSLVTEILVVEDPNTNLITISGKTISTLTKEETPFSYSLNKIAGKITNIENKIPEEASSLNKLVTEATVKAMVSEMAANRVTYNAAGATFPSRAALLAATTFYFGGVEYTPQNRDYCIIESDEGAPEPYTNGQTRWEYNGSSWSYAYGMSATSFTAAEREALESGITREGVARYEAKYDKPETGIPENHLTKEVRDKLNSVETDPTVPNWAKQPNKPSYTAAEVGAQEVLLPGTNIKKINNQSILGAGNINLALPDEVVTLTGNQQIRGVKQFTSTPVLPESLDEVSIENTTVPVTEAQVAKVKNKLSEEISKVKEIADAALTPENTLKAENLRGVIPNEVGFPILNQDTTGNAATADKLKTPRQIALIGKASGSTTFDGSAGVTLEVTSLSQNPDDYPVLNQDTTGMAHKLDTKRQLRGNLDSNVDDVAEFDGSVDVMNIPIIGELNYNRIYSGSGTGTKKKVLGTNKNTTPTHPSYQELDKEDVGLENVENVLQASKVEFDALAKRVRSLESLGVFVGVYETPSDLPEYANDLLEIEGNEDKNVTINDYATVRKLTAAEVNIPIDSPDYWEGRAPACFTITKIAEDGYLTWAYEFVYDKDTSGKADKVIEAGNNNLTGFDSNGNIKPLELERDNSSSNEYRGHSGKVNVSDLSLKGHAHLYAASNTPGGMANEALKAQKLTEGRLIGGIIFNGEENINLPGVNEQGSQNTTGLAKGIGKVIPGSSDILTTGNQVGCDEDDHPEPIYIDDEGLPQTIRLGSFAKRDIPIGVTGYFMIGSGGTFVVKPNLDQARADQDSSGKWEYNDGLITGRYFRAVKESVTPQLFLIKNSSATALSFNGIDEGSLIDWTASANTANGRFSATIPFSLHKRGIFEDENLPRLPRVRTFFVKNKSEIYEIYDSNLIDPGTGDITIYSNSDSTDFQVLVAIF